METLNAQKAIQAIPASIRGTDAADMLHDYAVQLRRAAENAPNGIFQKTYGIDQALAVADEIDNAGSRFRLYNKVTRPSNTYSELQTLVGRAVQQIYAIHGQVEVFNAADAELLKDLKDNAKIAGAGLGIGLTIVLVILGFLYFSPILARRG